MHVERTGSGPRAMVGIHGWAGSRKTWRRIVSQVPESWSFYAIDLPGYGDSPRPSNLSLESVMDELGEFLGQVASDEVVLLGNCGGALLGIEAARRFPKAVDRVVMLDPFGYPPAYFTIFLAGRFGRYAYYSTFANPIGRLLTNGALRGKRQQSTDLTQGFRDVDHELTLDYLRLMRPLADASRFAGMQVAVDVLYGEKTFKGVRASLPLWQSALPQARFFELAGAGHEPVKEATDEIVRLAFGLKEVTN